MAINQSFIKKLIKYINSKQKKFILILTVLSILTSILEIISIGFLYQILSLFSNKESLFLIKLQDYFILDRQTIFIYVIALFILAFIFSSILKLLLTYLTHKTTEDIGHHLSKIIFDKILHQDYLFYKDISSSDLLSAVVHKINHLTRGYLIPLILIVSNSFILLSSIFILVVIQGVNIIFMIMMIGFVYVSIIYFSKKKLNFISKNVSLKESFIIKFIQETFGTIRDILLNKSQQLHINKFADNDLSVRQSRIQIALLSGFPRQIIEIVLILILFFYIILIVDIEKFEILSNLPVLRTLPLANLIYSNINTIRGSKHSIKEVFYFLELPIIKNKNFKKLDFNNSINLHNISFGYPTLDNKVLSEINLNIKKNNIIGIFGKTGSGKSTLVDIIIGFLKPQHGQIYIDKNLDISTNINNWMNNISSISQNIFLKDDSILNNITMDFDKKNLDLDRLNKVLNICQIKEFSDKLHNKLDTIIGERGSRLSGGQKQRIGIARALYQNKPILILDEATNSLDTNTESKILKELKKNNMKKTILIISHNMNTLKFCDLVIKIENKKIKKIDHKYL